MSLQGFWFTSRVRHLALLLGLLLALMTLVGTASATPPEPLEFNFDVTYTIPASEGSGTWTASGVLNDGGTLTETYHSSGWDGCWRTVHVTSVLTGPSAADTITIRTQITKVAAEPLCVDFSASANWTIIGATGIFDGLHGQGKGTVIGGIVAFPDLDVHYNLPGRGHFD